MTAHETTPSDAAIAQAVYEMGDSINALSIQRRILLRAREIERASSMRQPARQVGRSALPELPVLYDSVEGGGTQDLVTLEDAIAYGEACRRMGNRNE